MQSAIKLLKLKAFSFALPCFVFFSIVIPIEILADQDISSLAAEFNGNTANTFQKIQILRSVCDRIAHTTVSPGDRQLFESMIRTGLTNQHASILGEAVYAAGISKNQAFVADLIELYYHGCRKYPGSQSIITSEVLSALGKIRGPQAEDFFIDVLN